MVAWGKQQNQSCLAKWNLTGFIRSFSKYLLSILLLPNTVLGARERAKISFLFSWSLSSSICLSWRQTHDKQVNIEMNEWERSCPVIFSSSFPSERKCSGEWGVWAEGSIPDSSEGLLRRGWCVSWLPDRKHQPSEESELECSMADRALMEMPTSHRKQGLEGRLQIAGCVCVCVCVWISTANEGSRRHFLLNAQYSLV